MKLNDLQTVADFDRFIAQIRGHESFVQPAAYAVGMATVFGSGSNRKIVDVQFAPSAIFLDPDDVFAAVLTYLYGPLETGHYFMTRSELGEISRCYEPFLFIPNNIRALKIQKRITKANPYLERDNYNHRCEPVVVVINDLAEAPKTAADVYLRLYLLSLRHVKPHGVNLDGMFGLLNLNVWTSIGVFDANHYHEEITEQLVYSAKGLPTVFLQDKIPHLLDYCQPSGVRITNPWSVRLGAYLADGTVLMTAGSCNFNAGTLGPCMIEGRISAGVVVGVDSDLGGGASTMGTLSGGGTEIISVGERCLIGANAGIGISLGDDCVVEAGLYVTAGTLVTDPTGYVTKARVYSGRPGLLFRRNSLTGYVQVLPRAGVAWAGLNDALHAN